MNPRCVSDRLWLPEAERIRTACQLAIAVDLVELNAPFYQRISEDARRMRVLGMTFKSIGAALGTDGGTAKRAIRWALGGAASTAPELARPLARYKACSTEALELKEEGWSLRQIGRRFGLSAPMVMRSLAFARKQARRQMRVGARNGGA